MCFLFLFKVSNISFSCQRAKSKKKSSGSDWGEKEFMHSLDW